MEKELYEHKNTKERKGTKMKKGHDKYCTQIKWLNSLTKCPQRSRQLSQPTLRREGEVRFTGVSSKKKCTGVATKVYSRKTLGKPKRGFANFKNKGSRVVYARGRYLHPTCPSQRAIAFNWACKIMTSIFIYFPFLCFFLLFGVDKRVALAPTYP